MARQRLRQWRQAKHPPNPADVALAAQHLSPPLMALFEAQHQRDVAHGTATARWLLQRGHGDPDLLGVALLHDLGKGHQRRSDRALYTLSKATQVASLLASKGSRLEWRRALARSLHHAQTGARLLEAAGASARVVELTRRHHASPGADAMLALLQQADTAS